MEFERRRHIAGAFGLAIQRATRLLPLVLFQCRFRIKRVDMRWTAVHEQKDDSLRSRREMSLLLDFGRRRLGAVKQRGQPDHPESSTRLFEHLPTCASS